MVLVMHMVFSKWSGNVWCGAGCCEGGDEPLGVKNAGISVNT
jgi:hypothetical protein